MPDRSGTSSSLPHLTRRSALKGIAGVAAAGAASSVLAACGSSSGSTKTTGSATSPITFGSNYSDPSTKAAFAALCQAATASTKVPVTVNTTDHNTFQNNISTYLQGTPD